jgi:hypothetical protein
VGFLKNSKLQMNVTNLFDQNALGLINSTALNATSYTSGGITMLGSSPNGYAALAPRAFSIQVMAAF